jgi:hypothetical protein
LLVGLIKAGERNRVAEIELARLQPWVLQIQHRT